MMQRVQICRAMAIAASLFCLQAQAFAQNIKPPSAHEAWQSVQLDAQAVTIREGLAPRAPLATSPPMVWRGGWKLTSPDGRFGGWSDLWVAPDESHLIAISDAGSWMKLAIRRDADGLPIGPGQGYLGIMRDAQGNPLDGKENADAEGLTVLQDGRFAVSFERSQSIRLYDLAGKGPFAPGLPGPALARAEKLPPNQGLESLTTLPDGSILTAAEGQDVWSEVKFWRAGVDTLSQARTADGQPPAPPIAPLTHSQRLGLGWGWVGMASLPTGDVLVLQRAYSRSAGNTLRLGLVSARSLQGGRPQVRTLTTFKAPLRLDNFEGLAAVRLRNGQYRLWLLSDDNFSPERQSTLLYAVDIDLAGVLQDRSRK